MARKQAHEDHVNHEAWAIPYGDLVTLLFALFTVMYAVSSVNEGKYRVLSDAMVAAFSGRPKTISPVQVGAHTQQGVDGSQYVSMVQPPRPQPPAPVMRSVRTPQVIADQIQTQMPKLAGRGGAALTRIAEDIERSLAGLIAKDVVIVRRSANWIEVEIKADILFPSGSADLSTAARPTLAEVAKILVPVNYFVRIEGYTDNKPIHTTQFPSNWELSGARAATVVRFFSEAHVSPQRLSMLGYGEVKPIADNKSEAGRNRNRRVVIVILPESAPPSRAVVTPKT